MKIHFLSHQTLAVSNRFGCDSAESVKSYSIRVAVVRVATSLTVASDAMNALVAMVLVDSNHAADTPFSVNPNPIYRNRLDVLLLLHGQNSNTEMMEYHFQYHHFLNFD